MDLRSSKQLETLIDQSSPRSPVHLHSRSSRHPDDWLSQYNATPQKAKEDADRVKTAHGAAETTMDSNAFGLFGQFLAMQCTARGGADQGRHRHRRKSAGAHQEGARRDRRRLRGDRPGEERHPEGGGAWLRKVTSSSRRTTRPRRASRRAPPTPPAVRGRRERHRHRPVDPERRRGLRWSQRSRCRSGRRRLGRGPARQPRRLGPRLAEGERLVPARTVRRADGRSRRTIGGMASSWENIGKELKAVRPGIRPVLRRRAHGVGR